MPTPCKKGEAIIRAGKMFGGTCLGECVQGGNVLHSRRYNPPIRVDIPALDITPLVRGLKVRVSVSFRIFCRRLTRLNHITYASRNLFTVRVILRRSC